MTGRPDHRLTGLEQYSLEKAGYFIRRGAISLDAIGRSAKAARLLSEGYLTIAQTDRQQLLEVATSEIESLCLELTSDLLPHGEVETLIDQSIRNGQFPWGRGFPLSLQSSASELAEALHGSSARFFVVVPLGAHEAIMFVPGTHIQPLAGETTRKIEADSVARLHEAVRVRLSPGDILVYANGLVRMCDRSTPSVADTLILAISRRGQS